LLKRKRKKRRIALLRQLAVGAHLAVPPPAAVDAETVKSRRGDLEEPQLPRLLLLLAHGEIPLALVLVVLSGLLLVTPSRGAALVEKAKSARSVLSNALRLLKVHLMVSLGAVLVVVKGKSVLNNAVQEVAREKSVLNNVLLLLRVRLMVSLGAVVVKATSVLNNGRLKKVLLMVDRGAVPEEMSGHQDLRLHQVMPSPGVVLEEPTSDLSDRLNAHRRGPSDHQNVLLNAANDLLSVLSVLVKRGLGVEMKGTLVLPEIGLLLGVVLVGTLLPPRHKGTRSPG